MSACAIHRRRHDSAIPRSFAISRTGFSRRRANSTARRRNSGGFGAGIRTPLRRPSSPHIWWSGKAGELQSSERLPTMIHIPLILAVKAAQVAYRNRELIAAGLRAVQSEATTAPATEVPSTAQQDHKTVHPSEKADAVTESTSPAEVEAEARATHAAHTQAMAASMKAWATKPHAW